MRINCAVAGLWRRGGGREGSRLASHKVSPTVHRKKTWKVETVLLKWLITIDRNHKHRDLTVYTIYTGNVVEQWLRCCATNRKVTGSIPGFVIGIFHWHNPSDRTMALGSTHPLTEICGSTVVKVLRYKSEGRWFDPRWCDWNFSLIFNPSDRTMALGSTQPLTEIRGATVVKVLCYKSEGRWFDPTWCNWNFSLTYYPSDRTMALGSTQTLTEMSTRDISWA